MHDFIRLPREDEYKLLNSESVCNRDDNIPRYTLNRYLYLAPAPRDRIERHLHEWQASRQKSMSNLKVTCSTFKKFLKYYLEHINTSIIDHRP